MESRVQRGLEIAATQRLRRKGARWLVPSQTGQGHYAVDPRRETCSCQDYEARQAKCKHIYAVEFTVRRETRPDGTTTVTKTVRVTYAQDWPAYNAAQTHEKARVSELLHGLCDGIVQPPQGNGRPRLPLPDVVFSAVMKVYSTLSGRRAMSDLRECHGQGYMTKAPHYNSVFHYLEDPALTPILKMLVEESASPLKAVETDFAVDASGFSTSTFARWYDEKYGKMRSEHQWIKAHLMVGVKTNIVTSVEVTEGNAHDSPHLPALVGATARRFALSEVSADKGYISKRNLEAVTAVGAVPYIPFKLTRRAKARNFGASSGTSTSSTGRTSWSIITSGRMWKRPSP